MNSFQEVLYGINNIVILNFSQFVKVSAKNIEKQKSAVQQQEKAPNHKGEEPTATTSELKKY